MNLRFTDRTLCLTEVIIPNKIPYGCLYLLLWMQWNEIIYYLTETY